MIEAFSFSCDRVHGLVPKQSNQRRSSYLKKKQRGSPHFLPGTSPHMFFFFENYPHRLATTHKVFYGPLLSSAGCLVRKKDLGHGPSIPSFSVHLVVVAAASRSRVQGRPPGTGLSGGGGGRTPEEGMEVGGGGAAIAPPRGAARRGAIRAGHQWRRRVQ